MTKMGVGDFSRLNNDTVSVFEVSKSEELTVDVSILHAARVAKAS